MFFLVLMPSILLFISLLSIFFPFFIIGKIFKRIEIKILPTNEIGLKKFLLIKAFIYTFVFFLIFAVSTAMIKDDYLVFSAPLAVFLCFQDCGLLTIATVVFINVLIFAVLFFPLVWYVMFQSAKINETTRKKIKTFFLIFLIIALVAFSLYNIYQYYFESGGARELKDFIKQIPKLEESGAVDFDVSASKTTGYKCLPKDLNKLDHVVQAVQSKKDIIEKNGWQMTEEKKSHGNLYYGAIFKKKNENLWISFRIFYDPGPSHPCADTNIWLLKNNPSPLF